MFGSAWKEDQENESDDGDGEEESEDEREEAMVEDGKRKAEEQGGSMPKKERETLTQEEVIDLAMGGDEAEEEEVQVPGAMYCGECTFID